MVSPCARLTTKNVRSDSGLSLVRMSRGGLQVGARPSGSRDATRSKSSSATHLGAIENRRQSKR